MHDATHDKGTLFSKYHADSLPFLNDTRKNAMLEWFDEFLVVCML